MEPAEDEGKGDSDGDDTAPHNEQMGDATHFVTGQDETVDEDVVEDVAAPGAQVAGAVAAFEKGLPAAFPVNGRRRPLQPHGIPVGETKSGKKNSGRIGN